MFDEMTRKMNGRVVSCPSDTAGLSAQQCGAFQITANRVPRRLMDHSHLDLLVSLRWMLKQAERSGRFDKKIGRRWENIPTRAKRSEEISHHRRG